MGRRDHSLREGATRDGGGRDGGVPRSVHRGTIVELAQNDQTISCSKLQNARAGLKKLFKFCCEPHCTRSAMQLKRKCAGGKGLHPLGLSMQNCVHRTNQCNANHAAMQDLARHHLNQSMQRKPRSNARSCTTSQRRWWLHRSYVPSWPWSRRRPSHGSLHDTGFQVKIKHA